MGRALALVAALYMFVIGGTAFAKGRASEAPRSVPGELILRLRGDSKSTEQVLKLRLASALAGMSKSAIASGDLSLIPFQGDEGLRRLRFPTGILAEDAAWTVSQDPEVQYAEPNFLVHVAEADLPNDPDFGKLWGLHNTGAPDEAGIPGFPGSDIGVSSLWARGITGSRSIVVGVIDTGISWTHPDLVDNLYTNPGEAGALATNGLDDDGNGFIDDVHGWNFVAKTADSRDDFNHGTHCAGTIGGSGNNGIGVVGMNWNVSLLPLKFMNHEGQGNIADAIEAVLYGVRMKAHILSNSWSGGPFSQALLDAIKKARDAGILFVAAAGNNSANNDAVPIYPANYESDNVISVAALDHRDELASFSDYGARKVHVAAPGVAIYSSVAAGDGYATSSGTSMATPHVAGLAALLWSTEIGGRGESRGRTYLDIKNRIIATSAPLRLLGKKVVAKGRVNAENAFLNFIPAPIVEPDASLWKDAPGASETVHPITVAQTTLYTLRVPGAKKIRAHFVKVDTEPCCDLVRVQSAERVSLETLRGKHEDFFSEYADGDTLILEMQTDSTVDSWGFSVDRVQVIE